MNEKLFQQIMRLFSYIRVDFKNIGNVTVLTFHNKQYASVKIDVIQIILGVVDDPRILVMELGKCVVVGEGEDAQVLRPRI